MTVVVNTDAILMLMMLGVTKRMKMCIRNVYGWKWRIGATRQGRFRGCEVSEGREKQNQGGNVGEEYTKRSTKATQQECNMQANV